VLNFTPNGILAPNFPAFQIDLTLSNGGRAEPMKKTIENRFFMAHGPKELL